MYSLQMYLNFLVYIYNDLPFQGYAKEIISLSVKKKKI